MPAVVIVPPSFFLLSFFFNCLGKERAEEEDGDEEEGNWESTGDGEGCEIDIGKKTEEMYGEKRKERADAEERNLKKQLKQSTINNTKKTK